MTTVDPFLNAKEVTALLKISTTSLYRRVADGTLPKPVKLGHLARWPRSEILAAVAAAGEKRSES